ncbi:hypothetical protein DSO57_1008427 [Entomophthora muscae]|uniref:Uncharacterized protein n=2 Tax=Entomophthora muscae TaxID=34485 RepID=A0ACC2SJU5_9FUNG|nr:hypothetical protein DSO57_1008427 [Entomophthora muscae]
MRCYFDPVLVTTMVVCSTGTSSERAATCITELSHHPGGISCCDLLAVVGHSQGCVVGMKVLELLLNEGKLEGKRVGILSLAGVHGGTFEPISNPLRAATSELALLAQQHDEGTVAYRQSVLRVLSAGVQVLAIHSFGDNLVNITSSTFGFLERSPPNLCLGLYLCKDQVGELSNPRERWVPRLYLVYLRARNLGFVWNPFFSSILSETDPFSTIAAKTYPLQMAFNWVIKGYPSVQFTLNHSELVSCDALYTYATLWLTADTSSILQNISSDDPVQSLSYYTDTFDFILSELNRAENFDSRLTPYTQPVRNELLQFRTDIRANFPDLKDRLSFFFFSRMDKLFLERRLLP